MDIVERLEEAGADDSDGQSTFAALEREAAREIRRLRADAQEVAAARGFLRERDGLLRELAGARDELAMTQGQRNASNREIERLRDENEALASNLRGKHATTGATYAHLIAERDRLRDENARLRADADECDALRSKLADILTRTANALKGQPAPLQAHSWHDLPECAQGLREDAERYRWLRISACNAVLNGVFDIVRFTAKQAPADMDAAIDAARKEE